MNVKWIFCFAVAVCLWSGADAVASGRGMMYSDTSRVGRPLAKDPDVIKFGGRYLMYYSIPPYEKPGAVKGWGIGIAESHNLADWTKVGEILPRVEYEKNGLCAPGLIVRNDTVHIFYQTYGNGMNDAICHAWSLDGLHFIRDNSNPVFRPSGDWNCGRAIDAEVAYFKGNYYLYYATRDKQYKVQKQGVAITSGNSSFSRNSWRNLSVNGPILAPELPWERNCIEAASIVEHDGRLYMFYAGGYNNEPQQIGVAVSDDAVNWTRVYDKPVLPNGKPGEWNSSESGHPHVFMDTDGKTYLFFQGNDCNGREWWLFKKSVVWKKDGRPYVADK